MLFILLFVLVFGLLFGLFLKENLWLCIMGNITAYLYIFALVGAILSVVYFILQKSTSKKCDKEGFLHSGIYPNAVDEPILAGDYDVKPNPGISDLGSAEIAQNYPTFPSDSCANNNVRYWNRPTNGRCIRPEMCGGLYEHTKQNIPEPPPTPVWGKGTRVNFYDY